MTALIILAHGSRRKESNQEIIELAKKVSNMSKDKYKVVSYAYLEVVTPDLINAIDSLVKDSISDFVVMPYFLNSGNHVTRDIPEMIEKAKDKYPNCTFKIAPFIGSHIDMPKLILAQTDTV